MVNSHSFFLYRAKTFHAVEDLRWYRLFSEEWEENERLYIENCSSLLFSPVQRTRSAATSSCAFGASAVKMRPKEKPAALVNTRVTAAPTSAVLFIKVQHKCVACEWLDVFLFSENGPEWRLFSVFSPTLSRLLGQARRTWTLLRCTQPLDGSFVMGHPERGTQEALPLCRRASLSAPGVSEVSTLPNVYY